MLFNSKKIQGLAIYYLNTLRLIEGGMPTMTTPQLDLLDGVFHEIAYTFKKGDEQRIYFDGKRISKSKYFPTTIAPFSGFAVKEEKNILYAGKWDIMLEVYDRMLTEEEIKDSLGSKN